MFYLQDKIETNLLSVQGKRKHIIFVVARMSWSIVSKAFRKSVKIMPVIKP